MWYHNSRRLSLFKLKKLGVLLLRKCHWWCIGSRCSCRYTLYLCRNLCPIWFSKLFLAAIWCVVSATTVLTWSTASAIGPSSTSSSAKTATTTTITSSSYGRMIWSRRGYTGRNMENPSKCALQTRSRIYTKDLASNLGERSGVKPER